MCGARQDVGAIGDIGKMTGDLTTEKYLLFNTMINVQYTVSHMKYTI